MPFLERKKEKTNVTPNPATELEEEEDMGKFSSNM
jgi:hypothetical protein